MTWHLEPWVGPALRASGAGLLCCSAVATRYLFDHHEVALQASPGLAYHLIALVAFAGASAGSAMLLLGAHLFDRVRISRPWARLPLAPDARHPKSGTGPDRVVRLPVADVGRPAPEIETPRHATLSACLSIDR